MSIQTQTKQQQAKILTRAGQLQQAPPAPTKINRVIAASRPILIITPPRHQLAVAANTLSAYLERGRQMHSLCRHSFIERVELGYYHYERRVEWRTCALAAAYAGAFGAASVERPEFSSSMAIWQLSQKLGYDLRQTTVPGPTGRVQAAVDEMDQLIDRDGWTRGGVVWWLESLGL